jgi:hypothetical protein
MRLNLMEKTDMASAPNQCWTNAPFVDSFSTTELVFPQASVIGLILFDSAEQTNAAGHRDQPLRVRLSSARARALAKELIAAADTLDGTGLARQ